MDVSWFYTVRRLHLCGYELAKHPGLEAWHERLGAHPAVAPFAEDMGALGSMVYAQQWLSGTTLESYVAAAREKVPGPS